MGDNKFWTCFVEGTSGGYDCKHDNLGSAMTEAERFARMYSNRGKKVYVLELVFFCEAQETPVHWTEIERG